MIISSLMPYNIGTLFIPFFQSEVIFGRDKICKRFEISKEYIYKVYKHCKDSPFKYIEGKWSCVVEDVVEFIRNNKGRRKV
jgi:hypothetical protein